MPASSLKYMAEEANIPMKKAEEYWEKAKEIAKSRFEESDSRYWPYVTGIVKKMLGITQSSSNTLNVTYISNVFDIPTSKAENVLKKAIKIGSKRYNINDVNFDNYVIKLVSSMLGKKPNIKSVSNSIIKNKSDLLLEMLDQLYNKQKIEWKNSCYSSVMNWILRNPNRKDAYLVFFSILKGKDKLRCGNNTVVHADIIDKDGNILIPKDSISEKLNINVNFVKSNKGSKIIVTDKNTGKVTATYVIELTIPVINLPEIYFRLKNKEIESISKSRYGGAWVVVQNPLKNKIMIAKRVGNNFGLWDFWGGGINKGERPKHAAIREFYEETGARIPVTKIKKLGRVKNLHFYTIVLPETIQFPKMDRKEHSRYKWIKKTKLRSMKNKVNPPTKALIRHLLVQLEEK